MNELQACLFKVPSRLDGTPDISRVPKIATIFHHRNQWWYEVKTGDARNNELDRRERAFVEFERSHDNLDFALGPFNFESNHINQRLNVPIERAGSPIVPLPESFKRDSMKDAANIPGEAKAYCWLNGSDGIENNEIDIQSNEVMMLLMGGLVYLDSDQLNDFHVLRINRFQPAERGRFRIIKGKPWENEYTHTLQNQNRLMPCSCAPFVIANIGRCAYTNPNERFVNSEDQSKPYIPTQNGAFLYLFTDNESQNAQDCLYELSPDPHGAPISNEDQ